MSWNPSRTVPRRPRRRGIGRMTRTPRRSPIGRRRQSAELKRPPPSARPSPHLRQRHPHLTVMSTLCGASWGSFFRSSVSRIVADFEPVHGSRTFGDATSTISSRLRRPRTGSLSEDPPPAMGQIRGATWSKLRRPFFRHFRRKRWIVAEAHSLDDQCCGRNDSARRKQAPRAATCSGTSV